MNPLPRAPGALQIERVAAFTREEARALVAMWRASFEHGVGVPHVHPIEGQIDFFLDQVLATKTVRVACVDGAMAGFMASDSSTVWQLYVHVDHLGRGIGTRLLDIAKAESVGHLELYTFARNAKARGFYEHQGFTDVGHGFEPTWQLEDVRYAWSAAGLPAP